MYEIKNISFKNCGTGRRIFIEANSEMGFNNPYLLFIPDELAINTLLVSPINTGSAPLKLAEAKEKAKVEAEAEKGLSKTIAFNMKMPIIVPLFSRVRGYYTHSLNSFVFNNDISNLRSMNSRLDEKDQLSEEEILEIREVNLDIPKQLLNMIVDAKKVLEQLGIIVNKKVIIEGYSATGKFSNLFTALYPEIILACISGGNCGLGIIPADKLSNTVLNFPLGVADIPNFNLETFSNVPQLYYIGDNDYNDPAMVRCNLKKDDNGELVKDEDGYFIPITDKDGKIIPVLDENGKLQPHYSDCYTAQEIELINTLLGANPQERFDNQKRLYEELGINAIFRKLPGTHKTIFQDWKKNQTYSPEKIIEDFIYSSLEKEYQQDKKSANL